MELKDRFILARKLSGLTQQQVADECGVSQPAINKIEIGKTKRPKNTFELCRVLNIREQWLIFEKGPMRPLDTIDNINKSIITFSRSYPIKLMEQIDKGVEMEVAKKEYTSNYNGGNCFAVEIENESMLPEFNVHEQLLIDEDLEPRNNNFCLVKYKNSYLIRKYIVDGGDAFLTVLNPNWPNKIILFDKQVEVIGVVVESRRKHI